MAHYDLELHQMDVKMAFLNGDSYENDYMAQPKKVLSWKKRIYGMPPVEIHLWVKSKSLQTVVFEVDEMIRKFGFKENEKDNSNYTKLQNRKLFFHILCIDDILLTSSDVNLPLEKFLSSSFNMNDLGEASLVLKIKIYQDRIKGYQDYHKSILRKDYK